MRCTRALEAAFVFDAHGSVNDATEGLEEIDERWRELNCEGVRALIHATPGTTRQVPSSSPASSSFGSKCEVP